MSEDNRVLLELAERALAGGPDRELDAEITIALYGWKPCRIPADYDGENACDVLTPDGEPFKVDGRNWSYPPKGKVHRAYHCPAWTRDCRDDAFPRAAVRQQTADLLRARASS